MRITVFQSAQGDCLLLSDTGDKARILVDGGMPASYSAHVAPALAKLRAAKKKIDLVYVSHIDRDHIGGVLRMLDDEVLWRVHEHQKKPGNGNSGHKPPTALRPPEISAIWHNSFHDQAGSNAGPIELALAASAPVLSGAMVEELRKAGAQQAGLVSSILDALRVSRRIGPKQLGIPLNALTKAQAAKGGNKLLLARDGQPSITLGRFKITILGPTRAHMDKLRSDWNTFVDNVKNKKALADIRTKALDDEKRLGASALGQLLDVMRLQAEALGDPKQVTPPNLASLTLLAEENGTSILLTGDARWDQIVEGLEKVGRLTPGKSMKIDVVKVPHHGSEHNVGETDLFDRVIGTDYVFCGNGHSHNPEIEVIEAMVKHRLKAPGKFKFWFNSSEAALAAAKDQELPKHMAEVERTVKKLAKKTGGRMTFKFLEAGSSLQVR
jgi:beta-lactamase superfamily II metal-dependent hydrolase